MSATRNSDGRSAGMAALAVGSGGIDCDPGVAQRARDHPMMCTRRACPQRACLPFVQRPSSLRSASPGVGCRAAIGSRQDRRMRRRKFYTLLVTLLPRQHQHPRSRRCARAVRVVIMDGSFSGRDASIRAAAGGMPRGAFGRNDPSRTPASVGSADVDAVLARFPGPVTLHVSRLKFVGLLAASLGFVVALLYILQDDALGPSGTAEAWLGIAFFSIGALVAIVMLLPGAGGLTLGP